MSRLLAAADAAGVPVLTDARVTQLFADETGRSPTAHREAETAKAHRG